MYGFLLRLDSGRQQRVGTDPLKKVLSPAAYKAVQERKMGLNSSVAPTNPFAPTLVRPSFYPEYFRATDIRTLYWKVRNDSDLHSLEAVTVDPNSRVVFTFSDKVDDNIAATLDDVLKAYGHYEFVDPKVQAKSISYAVQTASYSKAEAGE